MMPFEGGLAGTANGTFVLSVVAAALYLPMTARPLSWRRMVAKTAGVALLAVLSFVAGGPWLLTLALALSALGDACLAREGEGAFMAGLASFLGAHLAYAVLFAGAGSADLFADELWRLLVALAMIAFAGLFYRRLRPVLPAGMAVPVAVYVVAILAMGVTALFLPALVVIVGAVLFMASDAILATERFLLAEASAHRRWSRPAVWVLYYAGQLAITLGVLLA
ncbi:lysoplasmalogenase family protein [Nitratireductor arenosus]|nr:lysoplasmalogenase family protein [Nitratireductor arenosus]